MDLLTDCVERLERLRHPSDLCFARGGDAVIASISPASHRAGESYQSRLWRFGLDGSAQALTEGPGSDIGPRQSPVDERLAFLSDRSLRGKRSVFLLEQNGTRPLGEIPGTVEDLRWTSDGTALIALAADRGLDAGATEGAMRLSWGDTEDPAVTDPRQARRRLYRIDAAPGAAQGATAEIGPPDLTVWEFDLLGDQSALALVSADPSERGWYRARLARLDLARRTAEILHESTWQLQGPAADPDGRRVAFLEGWSSDRGLVAGAIRILDLASGRVASLAEDKLSNVTAIQWRDAESLWFAGWHRLGSVYGVIGLDGEIRWMTQEDAVIGPSSFLAQITPAPDGQRFAAIREAVGQAPEIVLKRVGDKDWQPLTKLNSSLMQGFDSYPEVRVLSWSGPGGLAMEGFLLLPRKRAPGPLPMICDIHGGPTWAVKHGFDPGFALPYAAAGYAVFLPNYRGNAGWGQDFSRLNIGDPGGAEFEDILAGIDYCIAQGFADAARIGVTGASYGGYLTAWAVATTDRFRAAIMVSGIANHWSSHYSCNHAFSEGIVGGPLTEARFKRLAIDRSPMMRLDKPATPTLIVHGSEDRCTPLGQGQELYAGLVERGVESELVVYPREGHGLREDSHRRDFWRRAVAWFDRYLRPDRTPA
jgi:dipeptidyl aminopeptidase/acylaminoacyl peptidase